jgi:hypothetical protein
MTSSRTAILIYIAAWFRFKDNLNCLFQLSGVEVRTWGQGTKFQQPKLDDNEKEKNTKLLEF